MMLSDWSQKHGVKIESADGRAFVYVDGKEYAIPSLYALNDCCVVSKCGCIIYLARNA